MRFGRIAVVMAALVLVVAAGVSADPITGNVTPTVPTSTDPRINISDPNILLQNCNNTFNPVSGLQFSFASNNAGFGFHCFQNASNVSWFNVQVTMPVVPGVQFPQDYSCVSDSFQFCQFFLNGNQITVRFFGLNNSFPGLGNGTPFFVDLTGDFGWVPNATFTATANVPEPATLSLLLTGLVGFVARRRLAR